MKEGPSRPLEMFENWSQLHFLKKTSFEVRSIALLFNTSETYLLQQNVIAHRRFYLIDSLLGCKCIDGNLVRVTKCTQNVPTQALMKKSYGSPSPISHFCWQTQNAFLLCFIL